MLTAAKYKLVWSKSLTYLILVNDLMYRTLPCKPIKLNYQAHMYNADADCQWIKNRNTANAKFLDTQIYSIHFANIFLFLLCTVYGIHRLFCYILGKQKKRHFINKCLQLNQSQSLSHTIFQSLFLG